MVINSILWIWCSYLLAFLGKEQIAESLSSNVCTVILGQIITYFLTKTVENIFKNNNFGGPPRWAVEKEQINTEGVSSSPTILDNGEDNDDGREECDEHPSSGDGRNEGVDPGCLV